MTRPSICGTQRKRIFQRDGNVCCKCGSKTRLEAHHITPVVYGGTDDDENLITLCHSCHRDAPNGPVAFFKWASTSLPPDMDHSKLLTNSCVLLLLIKYGLKDKIPEAKKIVDELYIHMWITFLHRHDDGAEPLTHMMAKMREMCGDRWEAAAMCDDGSPH